MNPNTYYYILKELDLSLTKTVEETTKDTA